MVSVGGKLVSRAFSDSWAGLIVGVGSFSLVPRTNGILAQEETLSQDGEVESIQDLELVG